MLSTLTFGSTWKLCLWVETTIFQTVLWFALTLTVWAVCMVIGIVHTLWISVVQKLWTREREKEERSSVFDEERKPKFWTYNTCEKFGYVLQKKRQLNSKPSYRLYRACLAIMERESIDRDPSLFIVEITRVISSFFNAFSIL